MTGSGQGSSTLIFIFQSNHIITFDYVAWAAISETWGRIDQPWTVEEGKV